MIDLVKSSIDIIVSYQPGGIKARLVVDVSFGVDVVRGVRL